VVAVFLLVATVTSLPYLVAALLPPAGRTFAGTFYWIDDFYNYVSFVQQAEDGRLLFENKLMLEPHAPALFNLEWWSVGALSRLLGRSPFLAYRVLALLALLGLLFCADRALRRLGVSPERRFWALILVATGGGLGGLLFELTSRPIFRCADLSIGLFPFMEALVNPHWLLASWLLLESLLAFERARSWREALVAGALGTALGLVRPYDLVWLVAIHGLSVLLSPKTPYRQGLLPLVGLLPVVLYNYWVFVALPTFATYSATRYAMPPAADFLLGLGPAAAVALWSIRAEAGEPSARSLRLRLCVWAGLAALAAVVRPVPFTQQFLIGAGLPLLLLAAPGLARLRSLVLPAATLLFGATAFVALHILMAPDPNWLVPAERREAALALREPCRAGGLVMAPPDIGLYVIGLTACRAYVSHPFAPDHAQRLERGRAFFGSWGAEERRRWLDESRVSHLVLPGDAGSSAEAWLGAGSAFEKVAQTGAGDRLLSVYARRRPAPGPPRTE
jgi:hypothetical protein